jgi:hypothetical protein
MELTIWCYSALAPAVATRPTGPCSQGRRWLPLACALGGLPLGPVGAVEGATMRFPVG